jgi:purine nucleosidase
MNFTFPPEKCHRVIVNSDAKNEADDQYAIVHAILTPAFDVRGIIPAHFGLHPGRMTETMEASLDEVNLLLRLMNLEGKMRVAHGAKRALPDEKTPQPSPGAELIIEEAMKDDQRPLNVLFYGPLTDMASAVLMEPRICDKKIHVIWIGGADRPTHYGKEFNLSNDVLAANLVMRSKLQVSQIPYPLYGHFCASFAELMEKVYPQGPLGKYLVEQLIAYNSTSSMAMEYRSLGDSPAVGVLIAPHSGKWSMKPAPEYDPETCEVRPDQGNRLIRVYDTFDSRFLLEDFYAKLAQFARRQGEVQ